MPVIGRRAQRGKEGRDATYEFLCEKCQKPFELAITVSEYEKGKARRLYNADVEKKLSFR